MGSGCHDPQAYLEAAAKKLRAWAAAADPSVPELRQLAARVPVAYFRLVAEVGREAAKPLAQTILARCIECLARWPGIKNDLERDLPRQLDRGEQAFQRGAAERRRLASGQPLSSVRPGGSHHIDDLPPSSSWTLVIDEGGTTKAGPGPQGLFVGVLMADERPLPPLPSGWHASESTLVEIDRVVQALLDAPVGVAGFRLGALPAGEGERWVEGVLYLVHWVAGLLPMAGPTRLKIRIENKGAFKTVTAMDAAAAGLKTGLLALGRERYQELELDLRIVDKTFALIGYADALAYTWINQSGASRARLSQSGLQGTCLVDGDATPAKRLLDSLNAGNRLTEADWDGALASAGSDSSTEGRVLRRLGQRARVEQPLWRRFFDHAALHLDGKAVDLRHLTRQVRWLEAWRPDATPLPPKLELAWLSSCLERDNHTGDTEARQEARLEELSERLKLEAPALVCQADLNRAVLETNRFEFEEATRRLDRWSTCEPSVPGLRHWARIQSSLGQHAAFRGQHEEAERRFVTAVEALGKLSEGAEGEMAQTGTYRAIAAIDDPGKLDAEVRDLVARVQPVDVESIARLSGSSASADKYQHHLLLRFICERGREEDRRAYLSGREGWRREAGHPWPLIDAYRAILLGADDMELASACINAACEGAFDRAHGPTVQYIGICIAVMSSAMGLESGVEGSHLDDIERDLPAAKPWIATLRESLANPRPPLGVLRLALPFNFR